MLKKTESALNINLYDYLKIAGELDVSDLYWDIGTTLVFDDCWDKVDIMNERGEDNDRDDDEDVCYQYDRYMKLILMNLPVARKATANTDALCDCGAFIMEWYNAYKKFVNEEHREEYTERWYTRHGLDLSPDVDEGFFEVFLDPFFELMNGNYSERQYRVLTDYLLYEDYLRTFYSWNDGSDDEEGGESKPTPLSYEEWRERNLKNAKK